MTQTTPADSVTGVVLPTGAFDLLLPSAAIAEIIGYHPLEILPRTPDWLLGHLDWRDWSVPVISFAAGGGAEPGRHSCLVVCYTPSGNRLLPYVAILAAGPPRLARFDAPSLAPADDVATGPFVLHALTFAGRPAWIPDMDAVERALLETSPPTATV